MVSALDRGKRALVSLLLHLAGVYGVTVSIARDSSDKDVVTAFRAVSRRVHPDKGGAVEDSQGLNRARDLWEQLRKNKGHKGRPASSAQVPAATPSAAVLPLATDKEQYRLRASAGLFTYQGLQDLDHWRQFLSFVRLHLKRWGVRYWTATLETNADEMLHAHVMLEFHKENNRSLASFVFDGLRPNVAPHDLLGDGWCKKRMRASIDRGHFYVWANKVGTQRDEKGELCVAGNYAPCWAEEKCKYQVLGSWPEKLWKCRKLSHQVYEQYLFDCRDGIPGRKRNFEAVREHERVRAEQLEIAANTKRLRSNPKLFQAFAVFPEAALWLSLFREDRVRYPVLVVLGPSFSGKTEWAHSLFQNPLELKVGTLTVFPERMRLFDRQVHDGIILDDIRDMAFLTDNQEKLQGKYNAAISFAETAGGTCAYSRYLYRVPVVVTANYSTQNLDYLHKHDWLGNASNRVVLEFPARAQ